MKISNRQFGEIEFTKEHVIKFEQGILGFEHLKDFLFIKTENDLFYWLNSVDQPEIVFPLVSIRMIHEEYPLENEKEPFGVVTLNSDPLKITVNLKAPVYLNQDTKTGYQKLIDKDEYPFNFKLFVEN